MRRVRYALPAILLGMGVSACGGDIPVSERTTASRATAVQLRAAASHPGTCSPMPGGAWSYTADDGRLTVQRARGSATLTVVLVGADGGTRTAVVQLDRARVYWIDPTDHGLASSQAYGPLRVPPSQAEAEWRTERGQQVVQLVRAATARCTEP